MFDLGFRDWGFGLRAKGRGFEGLRVEGLGFRVQGSGFRTVYKHDGARGGGGGNVSHLVHQPNPVVGDEVGGRPRHRRLPCRGVGVCC